MLNPLCPVDGHVKEDTAAINDAGSSKLKTELSYGPATLLPGTEPKELTAGILKRDIVYHTDDHCSTIF